MLTRTDCHVHTSLGLGHSSPLALCWRAKALGLHALHCADHADAATLEPLLRAQRALLPDLLHTGVEFLPGVCLAFLPPGRMDDMVQAARECGAARVSVHGESLGAVVPRGTNLAAIEAGCDVLLHPGLLTEEEARLAASRGVLLELCAHPRHCLANGHVSRLAMRHGAGVILGSGARGADELLDWGRLELTARGAGWEMAPPGARD